MSQKSNMAPGAMVLMLGVVASVAIWAALIIWAGQRMVTNQVKPLVITSDRGGTVVAMEAEVARLRATGQPVEIKGECLSTCTMRLGLDNLCVTRDAWFQFHAPRRRGVPLRGEERDHWARRIAAHYPADLAAWYLAKGQWGENQMRATRVVREFGVRWCGRGTGR